MGKKKEAAQDKDKAPLVGNAAATPDADEGQKPKEDPAKPEAPPDPPVVVELKVLDDKYLEIEREYEREVQAIQRKYTEKQEPLLVKRAELLNTGLPDSEKPDEKTAASGTPACAGFWLQSMLHLPALSDQVEEWDAPVLEYVTDIRKEYLDPTDFQKGFKLSFHFRENPYFTNSVLWKEYHTEEGSPYTGEIETTEIKASEIDWKDGKNVTVETVSKKVKGGGQKKQKKKAAAKEEPRDSFFRDFFKNLKQGMPLDDDLRPEAMEMDSDEEDDDEMVNMIMENAYEIGCSIRDQLIPFAVRWYTGEASPDDDDDDEDDDEDEDDDDDDDDDDEESETPSPPPKKKETKKKGGAARRAGDDDDDDEEESESPPPKKKETKKKGGGGAAPGAGGAGAGKAEECKQQ